MAGAAVPATLSGFFQTMATDCQTDPASRRGSRSLLWQLWGCFVGDGGEGRLVGGDLQMIKVRRNKHHWMGRRIVVKVGGHLRMLRWRLNLGFWGLGYVEWIAASTSRYPRGPRLRSRFINRPVQASTIFLYIYMICFGNPSQRFVRMFSLIFFLFNN
jgi:hypothetical protein